MRCFFLSPSEPRLRLGWRLLLHSITYNLLLLCLITPIILLSDLRDRTPTASSVLVFSTIAMLGAVTLSVFLSRRFLDRRPISSIGLKINRKVFFDSLSGFLIAGVMMGCIYLIELLLGWLKCEGFAWQSSSPATVIGGVLSMLAVFILVGWNEELLFRGYRLQNLNESLNPAWGLALSSIWFALAHLANPGVSAMALGGLYLAGLFLAYACMRTKQLWLPIGLHIGWNFFEGVVFGYPVSGMDLFHLIRHTISGPDFWTGGAFGPEAGLVLLPALAVGVALVFCYSMLCREF